MKLQRASLSILLCLTALGLVVLPACHKSPDSGSSPTIGASDPKKPSAPPGSRAVAVPNKPKVPIPPGSEVSVRVASVDNRNRKVPVRKTPEEPSSSKDPTLRQGAIAEPSEKSIQQQMERLAKALFFHNIPSQMRAGNSEIDPVQWTSE